MANITDEVQTEEQVEATLSPDELEQSLEAATPDPEANPEVVEDSPEEDLPEKYRGKSMKEVVQMHQEAEKRMGKQGSEVGELRGIVDDFIKKQSANATPAPRDPEPEEEVDFFADPQVAVDRAIQSHPDVRAARAASENLNRQSAAQALTEKHPDAQAVISDPGFAAFIKESTIRQELFVRADTQSDVAAADELLSQYKSRKSVAEQAAQADKASRSGQLKQASTGSAKGSSASQGKRIYNRSDIVRLMRDKPERYAQLADEIQQAYQEGRVK